MIHFEKQIPNCININNIWNYIKKLFLKFHQNIYNKIGLSLSITPGVDKKILTDSKFPSLIDFGIEDI